MSTMVDPPQARSALTETLAVLKPEWERNLTALQNGWLDTLQRVEMIADELMRRKIGTARGGRWHGRTMARLLDRLHLR